MATSDITAVVQRGRSVWMHDGTITVGKGDKARQIPVDEHTIAMPGDKISLPAKDMKALIEAGFVKVEVNPELPKAVTGGPTVLQEGSNAPSVEIQAAGDLAVGDLAAE